MSDVESHPAQQDDAQDAPAYNEAKASALGIDRAEGVGVLGHLCRGG